MRTAFPGVELEITGRWSGIFGWTSDYLPLVGPLPGAPDEMVITGFSGGGLPFTHTLVKNEPFTAEEVEYLD